MRLHKNDIANIRIYGSGLIAPFAGIKECLQKLFGIQAQAQQFGEISIFNRVKGITLPELQKMYESREIIKIWGQRMTVHMFDPNDWKTVHQAYAARENFVKRVWAEDVSALKKINSDIDKEAKKKILTPEDINRIAQKHASHITIPYRDYSIMLQATLEGIIFGVPQMPRTKYFIHRGKAVKEKDRALWKSQKEKAVEYLLLNYFENYGPATLKDFCHWSGLAKKETDEAMKKVLKKLTVLNIEGKTYYLSGNVKNIEERKEKRPENMKMLGKFDPLFVSFSDKSWITDAKQQKAIWRPAGHVEAVILSGSGLLGTWRYSPRGKYTDFNIEKFGKISKEVKKQIAAETEKTAAFLSRKIGKISYK